MQVEVALRVGVVDKGHIYIVAAQSCHSEFDRPFDGIQRQAVAQTHAQAGGVSRRQQDHRAGFHLLQRVFPAALEVSEITDAGVNLHVGGCHSVHGQVTGRQGHQPVMQHFEAVLLSQGLDLFHQFRIDGRLGDQIAGKILHAQFAAFHGPGIIQADGGVFVGHAVLIHKEIAEQDAEHPAQVDDDCRANG